MATKILEHYYNRERQYRTDSINNDIDYIRIDRFWHIVSSENNKNGKPLFDMVVWQYSDGHDFYHYIAIDKERYNKFMNQFKDYKDYLKLLYLNSYMSTSDNLLMGDYCDIKMEELNIPLVETNTTGQPIYIDDVAVNSKLICRRTSGIKEDMRSISSMLKKISNYFDNGEVT